MSIRILTIEHVNYIEKVTDNDFYVFTDACVNQEMFKGWMLAKHPGRYMDFRDTDYSHRMMYEHTSFTNNHGDFRVDGNSYVHTVLEFINEDLDTNDRIWDMFERDNNIDFDEFYNEKVKEAEE